MIESIAALVISIVTATAMLCDKLKGSKIRHCESCCGLFELDREVDRVPPDPDGVPPHE